MYYRNTRSKSSNFQIPNQIRNNHQCHHMFRQELALATAMATAMGTVMVMDLDQDSSDIFRRMSYF
jgi:hypothetical protein